MPARPMRLPTSWDSRATRFFLFKRFFFFLLSGLFVVFPDLFCFKIGVCVVLSFFWMGWMFQFFFFFNRLGFLRVISDVFSGFL